MHKIRKKQMKILGRIIRREDLENLTLTGRIEGKLKKQKTRSSRDT